MMEHGEIKSNLAVGLEKTGRLILRHGLLELGFKDVEKSPFAVLRGG